MRSEDKGEKAKRGSFFSAIGEAISAEKAGMGGGVRLFRDLGYAFLGFIFGSCHLAFGAYPLGISLVSLLNNGVFFALAGVVLGSFTLGKAGIIYALLSLMATLLRVVISGGEKSEDGRGSSSKGVLGGVFHLGNQSLVVRTSCAVIAGFVGAVYEILLQGISLASVLFGVTMIVSPAVIVFLLSGFFDANLTLSDLLFGGKNLIFPPISKKGSASPAAAVFFRISALILVFLISVSLKKYNILGIDAALIFSSMVTLFAAKRFGAVYGGVCGFASSFGISAVYSLSFVLAGIGAGAVFPFGTGYALFAGGALLSGWAAYAGGVKGFLSVLIEYSVSGVCLLPLFRFFEREKTEGDEEDANRRALDMVGTMALAYRNKTRESSEALEGALRRLSPMIRKFLTEEKMGESLRPHHPDFKGSPEEYYEFFSRILEDARIADEDKREMDEPLTEKLEEAMASAGLGEGVIRAFGKNRKYIICAAEDRSGEIITSKRFLSLLEDASGYKLSSPEYFRRGDMVLMECSAAQRYRLEVKWLSCAGVESEVSGDAFRTFSGMGGEDYILISDGMGSGAAALETSTFACEFLREIIGAGARFTPSLHGLNGVIRERAEEIFATVDLFAFDKISGGATFIKSGAPPSFIKRGTSLFRIKSETMPIGLLKKVDAESIQSNLLAGDTVIMFSDGVADNGGDYPELLELLAKPLSDDEPLSDFAKDILNLGKTMQKHPDDLTVVVARVKEIV